MQRNAIFGSLALALLAPATHAQTAYFNDRAAFDAAIAGQGISLNTIGFERPPDAFVPDGVVYSGVQFVGFGQAVTPHPAFVSNGFLLDNGFNPYIQVSLLPGATLDPAGVTAYSYDSFYHGQVFFFGALLSQPKATFDIATGAGSSYTVQVDNFAYGPATRRAGDVPESGTAALLGTGLFGLAIAGGRRRVRVAAP